MKPILFTCSRLVLFAIVLLLATSDCREAENVSSPMNPGAGGGQKAVADQKRFVSPRGAVTSADDNQPVSGATITAGEQSVRSNAEGKFTLTDVEMAARLSVMAEGYEETAPTVPDTGVLTVTLKPRVLNVTVQDKLTRQSLRGVTVTLGTRAVPTDDQGQAKLARVVPGTVKIQADGHASAEVEFIDQSALTISLFPTTLKGIVQDSTTGRPITNTLVYAGKSVTPVEADGSFMLKNQAEGSKATFKAAGFHKLQLTAGQDLTSTVALKPFQVRAIYIPFGLLSLPDYIKRLFDLVDRTELNSVVVDVKGDNGRLAYPSQVPLARQVGAPMKGLMPFEEFMRQARERHIYVIARLVIFKDSPLSEGRPDLAVRMLDGRVWRDRQNQGWIDGFQREAWEYNIAIAKEVAEFGVDEVQLDYIRFPTDGQVKLANFSKENTRENRVAAIDGFLEQFQAAMRPYGVFTSMDIFGLTTVVVEGDMGIGQEIDHVARYIDYLAPMLYPSTFRAGNMDLPKPYDAPYETVARSYRSALKRVPWAKIRPWLQHYSYDLSGLLAQKKAAEDAGAWGWTWWNAGGRYEEALFAPDHVASVQP